MSLNSQPNFSVSEIEKEKHPESRKYEKDHPPLHLRCSFSYMGSFVMLYMNQENADFLLFIV